MNTQAIAKMDKKFRIFRQEDCPKCDGQAVIVPRAWEEYWAANPKGLSSEAEDFEWFVENEWLDGSEKELPPEERPCRDCEGTGKVWKKINLTELLDELKMEVAC